MILFLTSTSFGWLLTIATLSLCVASTLMVEFKWASVAQRRIMLVVTLATVALWFAIVVARFISAT